MAVIISKQMPQKSLGGHKIIFVYEDSYSADAENPSELVGIILPDGRVASYNNQISEATVTHDGIITIHTQKQESTDYSGRIYVNGVSVVGELDKLHYYNYQITTDVMITIEIYRNKISTSDKYDYAGSVNIVEL